MTAPSPAHGWQGGAEAMRDAIAEWHEALSRQFSDLLTSPNLHLTADQAEKTRWAAASHSVHAVFVRRMPLPPPPEAPHG